MHADSLVIMGVAGCGKSSVARAVADARRLPLVEGDDFHDAANLQKMRQGIALTDADRHGWLDVLAGQLRARPGGAVLACSALKRDYRERLRAASQGLRFVFLDLDRDAARQRVAARGSSHFFSTRLIDSQFDALEPPLGEPLVLRLDALQPVAALRAAVDDWLDRKETT